MFIKSFYQADLKDLILIKPSSINDEGDPVFEDDSPRFVFKGNLQPVIGASSVEEFGLYYQGEYRTHDAICLTYEREMEFEENDRIQHKEHMFSVMSATGDLWPSYQAILLRRLNKFELGQ